MALNIRRRRQITNVALWGDGGGPPPVDASAFNFSMLMIIQPYQPAVPLTAAAVDVNRSLVWLNMAAP